MSLLIKNVILKKKKVDILVQDGKIKRIGNKIRKKTEQILNGKGIKAILPGLINGHTHAAMNLFRGLGSDLSLQEWLEKKIWPAEKKLTSEEVYWGTKFACLEMIKTGTTCFNDMYWFPEASITAVREMGLRCVIGLTLLDFFPQGTKENLIKNWERFKKNDISNVSFSLAPHSLYTVSQENLIWAKNFAEKNNLIIHLHVSETEKEVKECLKKHKVGPVEFLDKIGFLNENCILAHGVWLSKKEIKILAKRKCSLVYNPKSEMKLASGIFPYSQLKKANVNVCLGTDSAASNNNLDLFEEMRTGSLLQKIRDMNPTAMPAKEIFKLATKNGGQALKMKIGEIKEGYLADMILIDLNQICLTPGYDLISDLVYSCSGNCVSDLICQGKILMKDKQVRQEKQIIYQIKERTKK